MKTLLPLIFLVLLFCAFFQTDSDQNPTSIKVVNLSELSDSALAKVYLDSARIQLKLKKAKEALELNEKALTLNLKHVVKDSSLASNYYQIGLCHQQLKKFDLAKSSIKKAMDLSKEHESLTLKYRYGLLVTLQREGKYEESNKICKVVVAQCNKVLGFNLSLETKAIADTSTFILSANTYNEMAVNYMRLNKIDSSKATIETALSLNRLVRPQCNKSIADNFMNLGVAYYYKRDYEKSNTYYDSAYYHYSCINSIDSLKANRPLLNKGLNLASQMKNFEAIEVFEKAYTHNPKLSNDANFCLNYSMPLVRLRKFDTALGFTKKAVDIREKNFGPNHPRTAFCYMNLAVLYNYIGENKLSLSYNNKALNAFGNSIGFDNEWCAGIYQNLGMLYFHLGEQDSSITSYNKALNIFKNLPINNRMEVGNIYTLIGDYYRSQSADTSIIYYKKAINQLKQVQKGFNPYLIQPSIAIIEPYVNKEQYDLAEYYLDKAIAEANQERQKVNLSKKDKIGLLENRILLANHHSQSKHCNKDEIYDDLSAFVKSFKDLELEGKSYKFWNSRLTTILKAVLHLEISNTQKWNILNLTLNRKSNLSSNAQTLENSFNTPKELLNQELKIQDHLTLYEKKKHQELFESETTNDSLVSVYENKIFDLNRERDQLIETFKTDYPDYWNLKYNFEVASVQEVQSKLQDDQALVEYFVGDSSIFIFTLTKDSFDIKDIKYDFPLKDWVAEIRTSMLAPSQIYKVTTTQQDSLNKQYLDRAYQLYDKIIAPINDLINDKQKLIIVPDDILGYLPFDALISTPVDRFISFNTPDYLLRKYQISYAYSATLWLEMRNKKTNPTKNILAFAPEFALPPQSIAGLKSARDSLYQLKYSKEEVDAIDNIWTADVFSNKEAHLQNFLQKSSAYNIIHLSTHGKADDRVGDYCFLAFTKTADTLENLLYVRDLYNLKLNAEMVVLSACETGVGELQKGEGILSLARGFTYAGAKSIVSTLWSVNEKSTQEIMQYFYKNLKEGMEKDEALRQAKITYLDSSSPAAPFHWAAFTAIGDMRPIQKSNFSLKYITLGLLSFGLLFLLVRAFFKRVLIGEE